MVAESVLTGAVVTQAAPPWKALLAALAALLGVIAGFRLRPWFAVGVAIVWGGAMWGLELALLYADFWLYTATAILALIGSMVVAYVMRFLTEERKRLQVQNAFGHYLAPALVDRLVDQPGELKLGGTQEEITIMFADLSGFTALSGRIGPSELVATTNRYLELMANEIDAAHGYVDKFIGDAVMAVWGAPSPHPDHPLQAVEAGMRIAEKVVAMRRESEARGEPGFASSGPAIVGNVGSERRYNYTAVGETVNISARLEGLPGVYGCRIIIGPGTAAFVRDTIMLREIDSVVVKGRDAPLELFHPIAPIAQTTDADRRLVEDYEAALADYRA